MSGPERDRRDEALADQLRSVERGEAARWVHRPVPAWAPLLFGVLAASWVFSLTALEGAAWGLAHAVHLVAVLGLWFWCWSSRGSFPRGRMPRELVPAMYGFLFGCAATGLTAWALALLVAPWVAAVAAGVLAWGLLTWFDHAWAAADRRLHERSGARERLG